MGDIIYEHVRLRRICINTEDVSWTKERLRHYFHNCYKRTKGFFFIFNAAWLFFNAFSLWKVWLIFSFLGKIKLILYFWKYTHHRNLVDLVVYQNAYTKMSIMHYKKGELNPFFFLHKKLICNVIWIKSRINIFARYLYLINFYFQNVQCSIQKLFKKGKDGIMDWWDHQRKKIKSVLNK